MDVWKPSEQSRPLEEGVINILGGNSMPYLDMNMYFNKFKELTFGVHFKELYQAKYVNQGSCHTKACLNAIPYGTSIRCTGLTTITDENKHQSISDRYPRLHKALSVVGLILPDKKLPTFGELLSKREKDAAIAAARKAKNKKRDPRQIFLKQKYAGSWQQNCPAKIANSMARQYGCGFIRVRMCHGRHRNAKEILLADLDKKVMSGIDYINPREKYYKSKCGCRSTKVNGRCIMEERCNEQAVVYRIEWGPSKHYYIGKTKDELAKRIRDHIQTLNEFFKLRKNFQLAQVQKSKTNNQKPKTKSQNKTNPKPKPKRKLQIATKNITSTNSPPAIITPTNDQPCRCKTKCQTICKKLVSPNKQFTLEFGRPGEETYDNLHNQNSNPPSNRSRLPTTLKELKIAYNKIQCAAITTFLWKQVEMHEKHVRKREFSKTDAYQWVRSNLKVSVLYKQSLSSRMKTAGTKNCSLCKQERMKIYYDMYDPNSPKLLLNKRAELQDRCTCTTSFLRLVNLEGGC